VDLAPEYERVADVSTIQLNLDMAEEHTGGLLYLFLAHYEAFLAEHPDLNLSLAGAENETEYLWELASALDPQWRDASSAMSAGPRDFAQFAAQRARNIRLLPIHIKGLVTGLLPKDSLTVECRGRMIVEWSPDATALTDAGIRLMTDYPAEWPV
jgi:hypothetical protein